MQRETLSALIEAWKGGQEPKLSIILSFFNWLPVIFCPFGADWYYASVIKYGQETWWAPHNLERELFHLLGGFILGNIGGILSLRLTLLIVASAFFYKLYFVDMAEGKTFMKATLDWICWIAGTSMAGTYL